MGKHKIWRAQAKKMRRKILRQKKAQERDELLQKERERLENSPRYQAWFQEQKIAEQFQLEEEMRLQKERQLQWERDEELAQKLWKEQQERIAQARAEKMKQEIRIREEWEQEQRKIQEQEELKKKKLEEKQKEQERLMKEIDEFISSGKDLPASVFPTFETHPDKPACPFFTKTGACRFGDHCSRNHPRPGISRLILITNFYTHFRLNQFSHDEYDTDNTLEYEDSEAYEHFRDFYEDVLPEFEKLGRVIQFKVCCNFEQHLRGNVYVEYSTAREAVLAFQKFHCRWYAGRQLSVEFANVVSWRAAICGLFAKGRCPKGNSCNFLHTFRNPRNAFAAADRDFHFSRQRRDWSSRSSVSPSTDRGETQDRKRRNNKRERWQWSESPEPENTSPNTASSKQDRSHHSKSSEKSNKHYRDSPLRDKKRRSSHRDKSRDRDYKNTSHRKEKRRKHLRSRSRSR